MSMRCTIGSSMARGRSARILAIASLTSLTARSMRVSMRNSIVVSDWPSVIREMMCFTPATPATPSSIRRVTCFSSSAGAAPAWVTLIATIGMSTLGNSVIGRPRKLTIPRIVSTRNSTMGGIGLRIAQAETSSLMGRDRRWRARR